MNVSSTSSLPAEVLYQVFTYLSDSQETLYSASLVCRHWWTTATPLLYATPKFDETFHWAKFILSLIKNRSYGSLVRSIDFSGATFQEKKHAKIAAMNANSLAEWLCNIQPQMVGIPIAKERQNTVVFKNHATVTTTELLNISTSSLFQLAETCKNITSIDFSFTHLINDVLVEESGEYVPSGVTRPGLTHTELSLEKAIEAIGRNCTQLTEINISASWVNDKVLWMFAHYCPNLVIVDAQNSGCKNKYFKEKLAIDPAVCRPFVQEIVLGLILDGKPLTMKKLVLHLLSDEVGQNMPRPRSRRPPPHHAHI